MYNEQITIKGAARLPAVACQGAAKMPTGEGRWPRICERATARRAWCELAFGALRMGGWAAHVL